MRKQMIGPLGQRRSFLNTLTSHMLQDFVAIRGRLWDLLRFRRATIEILGVA